MTVGSSGSEEKRRATELLARLGPADNEVGTYRQTRRLVLVGFFEGYLISTINKRHSTSSLNILKVLRLSLFS